MFFVIFTRSDGDADYVIGQSEFELNEILAGFSTIRIEHVVHVDKDRNVEEVGFEQLSIPKVVLR